MEGGEWHEAPGYHHRFNRKGLELPASGALAPSSPPPPLRGEFSSGLPHLEASRADVTVPNGLRPLRLNRGTRRRPALNLLGSSTSRFSVLWTFYFPKEHNQESFQEARPNPGDSEAHSS